MPAVSQRALALGRYLHPRFIERVQQRLWSACGVLYRTHGPEGRLARTWPTGSMVLWVAILLAACLVFYYV